MSTFELFRYIDSTLAQAAAQAETHYERQDFNACLVRLRQIAEDLAWRLVEIYDLTPYERTFNSAICELKDARTTPDYVIGLFRDLQRYGNRAAHSLTGDAKTAGGQLFQLYRLMLFAVEKLSPSTANLKRPKFVLPTPTRGQDTSKLRKLREEQEKLARQLEESENDRERYEQELAELQRTRVVISESLQKTFAQLQDSEREEVGPLIQSWRQDPDAIAAEKIAGSLDDKFEWYGLGDEKFWGVIGARSPASDVLVGLWIGAEFERYDWALQHRFDINPVLGSFQLYAIKSNPQTTPDATGLFDAFSDDDLILCAVPKLVVSRVREVTDESQLNALFEELPGEAVEALLALATGSSVEEARREVGLISSEDDRETIDPNDFHAALERPLSGRYVTEVDDEGLRAMLDAPFKQWRVYLHPSQRACVQMNGRGPIRVLGGAGTGKTVALVHRAVHLVRNVFETGERILVTTFTRNLASELAASIAQLATPEEFERIDVANIHKVARDIYKSNGMGNRVATRTQIEECWAKAYEVCPDDMSYSLAFFMDEWRHVIVPQDIQSSSEYARASRRGRGTRIHKLKRPKIWPVFEAFRKGLDDLGVLGWDDLIMEARALAEQEPEPTWRAVLSDEVQDYRAGELKFLRALVDRQDNDMFLVGDSHQRIYGLPASFKACGIQIVGRSVRLKINYRTTEAIRALGVQVLAGQTFDDMNEGTDTLGGYTSIRQGHAPAVHVVEDVSAERDLVFEHIREWIINGNIDARDVCIAAPTKRLRDRYASALDKLGRAHYIVDKDDVESAREYPGVRLATFHRLKGLEFRAVVLVGVQAGLMPLALDPVHFADDTARNQWEQTQRSLLYVAITRARDELCIVGVGEPCPFISVS